MKIAIKQFFERHIGTSQGSFNEIYEEHMVRKIADLIYVEHKDFIDAKLRVKERLFL